LLAGGRSRSPPTTASRSTTSTRPRARERSNDGSTLWRIYTYEEDGSAEYSDGTKLVGKFWACARRPIPAEGVPIDDLLAWSAWEFWAGPLNSRKDAIAEALR
jgi:hypothetical protein